ncbi:MAG: hypothetical protein AB7F86_16755 [Bdellovibrionales bacterium]
MKFLKVIFLSLALSCQPARADMFGGDVAVLMQILANALEQLAQLRQMLQTGQDTLSLMEDINRGINDSLSLARTISPDIDPGLYKNWATVQEALGQLQIIYGVAESSKDQKVYQDADQSVAEAVKLNNSIFDYTKKIDELGESIKSVSHQVSPGGAQKLTAQTLGVVLHVMNQSLRTQGTGLKLQAQAMALQNKKEKDATREYLSNANALKVAMKSQKADFNVPRFQ